MGRRAVAPLFALAALFAWALLAAPPSAALSAGLVISQVYPAGGNSGAAFNQDYVEMFNRGTTALDLDGISLQYASAGGSGGFGSTDQQLTLLLDHTLAPGHYLLVGGASGDNGAPLTAALDVTDTAPINMGGSGGKVALVRGTAPLGCNGGSTTCTAQQLARLIDLVGYGNADFAEGSATNAPNASNALFRGNAGCTESDDNATDFSAAPAAPRNNASPPHLCNAMPTATATPLTLHIPEVQGAGHRSTYVGAAVVGVPGIVTARRSNGFYLQDPQADGDDATSEGILVFTGAAPGVSVGDSVVVSGTVNEFRPSGAANLSTTEIVSPTFTILSSGNTLPAPVIIGSGGRIPPERVIEDDATGDVENGALFDPANDGLDFYESLEGMRVQVNDPLVVGPTNSAGEIVVVSDGGARAGLLAPRGALVIRADDFNPERIILDDALADTPDVDVGDRLSGPAVGVIDYGGGNYKLEITAPLQREAGGLRRETAQAAGADQLAIAGFNVENLAATDRQVRFDRLAALIVANLRSPDIVALAEVQDNSGATDDGTVAASGTLDRLVAAIGAAGGPAYQYRQIDPQDNADGGEPGGNIRVGFLYRADRGLQFVDRPGGSASGAVTVTLASGVAQLSASPGRIDPTNAAWADSRKPLAAEFAYNGQPLFVIAAHFNSKGGDDPLFGRFQPPRRTSEATRKQQAAVVNGFIGSILALDPGAKVAVVGDMNDFQFSDTLQILRGAELRDLVATLPENERYSYVYEGNAEALDHILVSAGLAGRLASYDIVHVNAEFSDQASDHDPEVAIFNLAGGFSDVRENDYFYAAVQYLVAHGVIGGYADGTFRPYNPATRGQLAKIVVLARAFPISTPAAPTFSDVPTDNPFFGPVETAYSRGIIGGYSDGTFRPYAAVTRGQLTKIVVGAMGWPTVTPERPTFADVPTDNPFFAAIETAVGHGIISGYADGTFRWQNGATRGQIAKIVHLALTAP